MIRFTIKGKKWLLIQKRRGDHRDLLVFEGREFTSDRKKYDGEEAYLSFSKAQATELLYIIKEFLNDEDPS